MTTTDAARTVARQKLAGLFPGQTGLNVADEIADAITAAIEAAVRKQVADEIYAAIEAHHANDPEGYEGHHHRAGLYAAAKIALGTPAAPNAR